MTQSFFHISDVHFGYEDRDALAWVETEIAAHKPDGVIITGDLTMRARHREFAAAKEWITRLPVPAIVEPGNHDIPSYLLPERYLRPLDRFYAFQQQVQDALPVHGASLVPLNTNVAAQPRPNWSKGWVSDGALAQCLKTIDALPADQKAIVLVHHPLREAGTDGTAFTRGGAHALEELAKRNVVAVLSGHVHDAFDLMEDTANGPVRMIGAGTLSQRLRATPPSYNMLCWDGHDLSVSLRSQ